MLRAPDLSQETRGYTPASPVPGSKKGVRNRREPRARHGGTVPRTYLLRKKHLRGGKKIQELPTRS